MVQGIGKTPTPTQLRLVVSNSDSSVRSERARHLKAVCDNLLNVARNNPSMLEGDIATSIIEIFPNYQVRLDLLSYRPEGIFASTRFAKRLTYAFCGEKTNVSLVINNRPGAIQLEGDPEFITSMQAMNNRREILFIGAKETCFALPLIGKGNRVLGAIVLYTEPKDKPTPINPEDQEIFRQYAQKVSELLDMIPTEKISKEISKTPKEWQSPVLGALREKSAIFWGIVQYMLGDNRGDLRLAPSSHPNNNPDRPVISAERSCRLQEAFAKLDAVKKTNPSSLAFQITTLILEIIPKWIRLDLLSFQGNRVFISTSFGWEDAYSLPTEKRDITQRQWDENDPASVAAMQAIKMKKEIFITKGDGKQFIGLPLLGKGSNVLGAIVLANQTEAGISPITQEDEEIFRQYAQHVGSILS